MTSNDASRPGAPAGRRRTLGRGPGTPRVAPPAETTPGTERVAPAGSRPAETASAAEPVLGAPETSRTAAEPDAAHAGRKAAAQEDPEAPTSGPPEATGVEDSSSGGTASRAAAGPEAGTRASATASEGPGPGNGPSPSPEAREPVHAAPAASPPRGPEASPAPGAAPHGAPEDAGDGVFKVRLANFEGPFDLLLQLIAKHKMDVTEVALSEVTDEFMAHIRAMDPDWDLDETTEFLVVAATLLDLKAARLLPAAEVEDEADLALLEARDLLFARLLQYRAYKQIAEIFNGRLEAEARRHPRTVGLEPHHAALLPEVVISIGPEGFAELAVKAMRPRPQPQVYVEHIHAPLVSVQEQARIVVARLRELGEASFDVLVEDTEDTLTVVARFLALLELYREKAVALDQETALGDLLVRWTGGDGDAGPAVTDEFDRPPGENGKTEEERA
ncbi:segregation/condensation protein A [Streptomyces sp. NPDC093586]|uniref:segregation/condensation protein A n=1 Tax=Streptomyces sp. NPDC093586 TaxID=3366042 RepID=UPI00381C6B4C